MCLVLLVYFSDQKHNPGAPGVGHFAQLLDRIDSTWGGPHMERGSGRICACHM